MAGLVEKTYLFLKKFNTSLGHVALSCQACYFFCKCVIELIDVGKLLQPRGNPSNINWLIHWKVLSPGYNGHIQVSMVSVSPKHDAPSLHSSLLFHICPTCPKNQPGSQVTNGLEIPEPSYRESNPSIGGSNDSYGAWSFGHHEQIPWHFTTSTK